MLEHKRSPVSVDQGSLDSFAPKRRKADMSMTSKVSFSLLYFCITLLCFVLLVTLDGDQERKDKLGEKIAALQQLVSPYGKTDTASVLLETMEYITFLHEQVKVLCSPYLQCTPAANLQELERYSLRSKGLCLVPNSSTGGVASSNGADIWAPIKTSTPKF
ncbi:hypothetical protein RHSIM_Rhsim09G0010400 [Rhododendron simsii]|uniref:BHLH domain-containing protein n=1 Tax=Rhododendron simsii TaxID=118357 RepID=A0A834GDW0_RHOSS|nr:hypothetical protein RHSIM_Rhsim09G0010400 [Rhododendron simsii]